MSSLNFLKLKVIGQEHIINELAFILEEIKEKKNFNIMLRGPSGYGKTLIAQRCVEYLNEKYNYMLGENFNFSHNVRLYIMDEIHEIKTPEILYPLMDSNKLTLFMLTNEFESLKEPLVNRCIIFNLKEYSDNEIAKIIKKRTKLPIEYCIKIASYCRGNPRVAILTSKRLEIILRRINNELNINLLKEIIEKYIGIKEGGFTYYDEIYLDFLKKAKRASLDTLSYSLLIPKETIKKEIEPFLLKKGLIQITSKGRIITE